MKLYHKRKIMQSTDGACKIYDLKNNNQVIGAPVGRQAASSFNN